MSRKAFIITVNIDDEALDGIFGDEGTAENCITAVLNSSRFLANPSVELAPDSVQPINTEGNQSE